MNVLGWEGIIPTPSAVSAQRGVSINLRWPDTFTEHLDYLE